MGGDGRPQRANVMRPTFTAPVGSAELAHNGCVVWAALVELAEGLEKSIRVDFFLKRSAVGDASPQDSDRVQIGCPDILSLKPPAHFVELVGNSQISVSCDLKSLQLRSLPKANIPARRFRKCGVSGNRALQPRLDPAG